MKFVYRINNESIKEFGRKLIPLFALIMFAFFPTSHNSEIFGKIWTLTVWILIILYISYIGLYNRINYDLLIRGVAFILLYVGSITVITLLRNEAARLSLYRIAPLLSLIFLTSFEINDNKSSHRYFRRLLDTFFIVMLIWNILILLGSDFIKEFTINNYSQYYKQALINTFYYKKTVMSFGVHTWASYFYIIMFYLSYVTATKTHKIRFYVYSGFSVLFTIFLTSNSSLVYGIIMMIMMLWLLRKKPVILFLIVGLIIIVIFNYWEVLWERYKFITQSGKNGLISRYLSEGGSFQNNFKIILSSLGIGFCILEDTKLGYSDSGYVVYLTMGSLPLMIVVYTRTYNFLVRNIDINYRLFILFIILSFEFALPATYSYRFPFVIIFVIYYLNNLSKSEETVK